MSDGSIGVRESLQAAMTELTVDPVVVDAPVVAEAEPAPAETAATIEKTGTEAPAAPLDGRDEKGRFVPKEPKATEAQAVPVAEEKPETATAAEPEPQSSETTRVPHALPAPLKAEWADLPEKWRDAFVKQEDSIKAFRDEQQPKATRLNRFDEILGPHLDQWRLNGLDEFSGVQTLLAAQNILERNPVQGLVHIARSYGVNPQQIAEALGLQHAAPQTTGTEGQTAPTQPDLTAALQPYLARVQTLEQQLQAVTQGTEAEMLASARAEVDAFASKPENMYFENVKADVSRRLESGAAATLADAYEQAIWASAEIRPLLIKAQGSAVASKDADTAARLKAEKARQSAGSVTGAPASAQALLQGSKGSVRADLEAAREALSGTV